MNHASCRSLIRAPRPVFYAAFGRAQATSYRRNLRLITRFETGLATLAQIDRDEPIGGRTVERVESLGKHLLMTLSGGLVLRTHLRMNGSWHIYRPGETWRMPARAMRILIATPDWVAVAFNVYVAEFALGFCLDARLQLLEPGEDARGAKRQNYCSLAYSALACLRIGMSGSASFHSARKSW